MTIITGAPESTSHCSICQGQGQAQGGHSHLPKTDMLCQECASRFFSVPNNFLLAPERLEFSLDEIQAAVASASEGLSNEEIEAPVENASNVMPKVDLAELAESLGLTDELDLYQLAYSVDLDELPESVSSIDETTSEGDLDELPESVSSIDETTSEGDLDLYQLAEMLTD